MATARELHEILSKIQQGPFVARDITKKETHENSPSQRDKAWEAGEQIFKIVVETFMSQPPEKKYDLASHYNHLIFRLYSELHRTFLNTFRHAEEGSYRSAFADLRDMLELIMKIKYFYENTKAFDRWIKDLWVEGQGGEPFDTRQLRKVMHKEGIIDKALREKLKIFLKKCTRARHSSKYFLDKYGFIPSNANYYQKLVYDDWCKHMIELKELVQEFLSYKPTK